ncbi:MAG: SDR family NAD(P)-dependent oxidoreductase [bacterium]|nr:SDR family NAD(P)-dependent oxidoreductase [bacterium]
MTYIITGISRGLGAGIVEILLAKNEKVIGVGRSNPFGDAIGFISCDLGDPKAVSEIEFGELEGDFTLVNNAGIIGEIKRISEQESSDLEHVMQVNVFAPMTLTRKIYAQLDQKHSFTLVNISSGAANRSIPSWAAYCASKAALNRLTENFYLEEQERGRKVTAYAIAPGVIDTGMQVEIRSASAENFSSKDAFVEMKEEGKLYSAEEAANRVLRLLQIPFTCTVFQDVRSLEP